TDAAVACAKSNAVRLVGAVNQITWTTEIHGIVAQGIIGAGRHDRRKRIALPLMVLTDGSRNVPGRMFRLSLDHHVADRRRSAFTPDADRISEHFSLFL